MHVCMCVCMYSCVCIVYVCNITTLNVHTEHDKISNEKFVLVGVLCTYIIHIFMHVSIEVSK